MTGVDQAPPWWERDRVYWKMSPMGPPLQGPGPVVDAIALAYQRVAESRDEETGELRIEWETSPTGKRIIERYLRGYYESILAEYGSCWTCGGTRSEVEAAEVEADEVEADGV